MQESPTYASLIGWGHYAPEKVITNDDLAEMVDTSDEWIRTRTGIQERRVVHDDQAVSDLCVEAGRMALDRAGLSATDLDLILVATSSPDYMTPPVSSIVQDRLGAGQIGAMTLMVGCSGFVYGLVTADKFIKAGAYKRILLIGAEVISKYIDWEDRTTCVLFGDGAGAVILEASETPCGIEAFELGSDGSGHEAIVMPTPGSKNRPTHEAIDNREIYLRMEGREVFKFATRTMAASIERVLDEAGLTSADIDLFIPHQANARIIDHAAKKLGLPEEKVVMNVAKYGNTSAASVPIALSEALEAGRAGPQDRLALVGFGAGLTWGTTIFNIGPITREVADASNVKTVEPAHVEGLIA